MALGKIEKVCQELGIDSSQVNDKWAKYRPPADYVPPAFSKYNLPDPELVTLEGAGQSLAPTEAEFIELAKTQKAATEALKYDNGKSRVDLIPASALLAEGEVLAFGAKKYASQNWRKGMDWDRLIGAALRHIIAFNNGEDKDAESGLSHLAHARCCLAFLIEYQESKSGNDNRYKK